MWEELDWVPLCSTKCIPHREEHSGVDDFEADLSDLGPRMVSGFSFLLD